MPRKHVFVLRREVCLLVSGDGSPLGVVRQLEQRSSHQQPIVAVFVRLGRLVADGTLERGNVEAVLLTAALVSGLAEREAARTIRSGLGAHIVSGPPK